MAVKRKRELPYGVFAQALKYVLFGFSGMEVFVFERVESVCVFLVFGESRFSVEADFPVDAFDVRFFFVVRDERYF